MLVGYRFSHSYGPKKTPYDYLTDKQTGLRPDEPSGRKPNGVSKIDLRDGVKSFVTLPPVMVWDMGKWYFKLADDLRQMLSIVKQEEEWDAWVVSGEGTPGNYLFRVYILPDKISTYETPEHPEFWSKQLQEKGNDKLRSLATYSTGSFGYGSSPAAKPPEKPKPPPLPVGIRFRCRGCGHFFREADLAGHSTHCCPAETGPEGSDWVIQCECCETLAEVAACLDGFPLDKKKEEEEPAPEEPKPSPDEEPLPAGVS